jgi:hypothetical protein
VPMINTSKRAATPAQAPYHHFRDRGRGGGARCMLA